MLQNNHDSELIVLPRWLSHSFMTFKPRVIVDFVSLFLLPSFPAEAVFMNPIASPLLPLRSAAPFPYESLPSFQSRRSDSIRGCVRPSVHRSALLSVTLLFFGLLGATYGRVSALFFFSFLSFSSACRSCGPINSPPPVPLPPLYPLTLFIEIRSPSLIVSSHAEILSFVETHLLFLPSPRVI